MFYTILVAEMGVSFVCCWASPEEEIMKFFYSVLLSDSVGKNMEEKWKSNFFFLNSIFFFVVLE